MSITDFEHYILSLRRGLAKGLPRSRVPLVGKNMSPT
jgi:hypothetical protein